MAEDLIPETGEPDSGYQVLARKYRPSNFDELIGQEPMVRTLTNAFSSGRIAQAWMLTGVRGVGKTTTARILARALNYESETVKAPTVELQQLGTHCQAIMDGRHMDVVEMDAASNTGIDDIKQIIDSVRYAPVSARYKVYIIDEVHMISDKAFNALLKTLEEPPPHAKFIFATTEIRKVPVTILSRCQRFDLRRVDAETMRAHLHQISQRESIDASDDAMAMIVRAGEGSVRDSLSLLDQATAHGAGHINAETVTQMLGLADRNQIIDLFEALMSGSAAGALEMFQASYERGAEPVAMLADLARFCHVVTRLKVIPAGTSEGDLTPEEVSRGRAFSESLAMPVLSRAWQMLLKGIDEVKQSEWPFQAAEMVLIRLVYAADLPTLDAALKRLDDQSSSKEMAPTNTQAHQQNPTPTSKPPVAVVEHASIATSSALKQPEPAPAAANDVAPASLISNMEDLVALASKHRDMVLKSRLKQHVRPVRFEPGSIEIALTATAPKTLAGDLSKQLLSWTGQRFVVSVVAEGGGKTLNELEAEARQAALQDAGEDPVVQAVLNQFPGAKIVGVRLHERPEADIGLDQTEPDET